MAFKVQMAPRLGGVSNELRTDTSMHYLDLDPTRSFVTHAPFTLAQQSPTFYRVHMIQAKLRLNILD